MIRRRSSGEERAAGAAELIETHQGRVLKTGSNYLGDGDSTDWAVVLDDDGVSYTTVGYCSTYCSCYARGPRCVAIVDAPESVATAYLEQNRIAEERAATMSAALNADYAWHRPSIGSIVRVVHGRKVPIGIEGLVYWSGDSKFGPRIGVSPLNGADRFFIATSNVAVVFQPGLGIDPCGEMVESIPAASLQAGDRISTTGSRLILDGRPDFPAARHGCLVTPANGEQPLRYWGYAVIPVRIGGVPELLALHYSGQSDWSVVRLSAVSYQAPHPQTLLEWLLRPANAPTPEYQPGPPPPPLDPRTGKGARLIVDGLWELLRSADPAAGISYPLT